MHRSVFLEAMWTLSHLFDSNLFDSRLFDFLLLDFLRLTGISLAFVEMFHQIVLTHAFATVPAINLFAWSFPSL